jgi:choline dehydrogenase-like flavoprotein
MNTSSYDVIVIGTGAGGACAAYEMAKRGMNVLALEKGPRRELEELGPGGSYGPAFTDHGRGDELKYISGDYIMPHYKSEPRFLSYAEPGQPQPEPQPTTMGWMSQLVGGGTVHYGGASFRMQKEDFALRTRYQKQLEELEGNLPPELRANLQDWPLEYGKFESWYAYAEKLIGIAASPSGDLPPIPHNRAAGIIASALKGHPELGKINDTPMAINSGKHGGRKKCVNSGLCQEFACRYEAKSDMRVTVLREAEKTGRLTIQPLTFVRKLNYSGRTLTSIECVTRKPDGTHEVRTITAKKVVVAGEAIETNRLLVASGIGDPSLVGRYFMLHMTGGSRSLAPEPTTTWDTAPHGAYIPTYYHAASSGPEPFLKAGIVLVSSNGGPLAETKYTTVNGRRLWGNTAATYFEKVYPFKMDLSYIGECLATLHNRVGVRSDKRDIYGMPVAEVIYKLHPFDWNSAEFVRKACKKILMHAGGKTEDDADDALKPFLRKASTAKKLYHASGGCRMGEDPKTSVVSPDCRVHGLDNLYLTDASVFPSCSGANFTLTIQANALRVGALIAGDSSGKPSPIP